MSKKIYLVIRTETSSEYIYVEANSKDDAIEIASATDSECWRQNQDYNSKLEAEIIKNKKELVGRYVETSRGSYLFDKSKLK